MQCSISDYPTTAPSSSRIKIPQLTTLRLDEPWDSHSDFRLTGMTSYHSDSAGLSCVVFQRSLHPTENICGGSHDNALRDETQTWLLTFLSWTCLVYWRQHPSVCWIDNAAFCGSHEFVNCLACTEASTGPRNIGRKNCRRKQHWLIFK
jgi:hypothetical protein